MKKIILLLIIALGSPCLAMTDQEKTKEITELLSGVTRYSQWLDETISTHNNLKKMQLAEKTSRSKVKKDLEQNIRTTFELYSFAPSPLREIAWHRANDQYNYHICRRLPYRQEMHDNAALFVRILHNGRQHTQGIFAHINQLTEPRIRVQQEEAILNMLRTNAAHFINNKPVESYAHAQSILLETLKKIEGDEKRN